MKNRNKKMKIIFACFLCATLAWMGFIFMFSAENDTKSTERSDVITDRVAKAVNSNYTPEEKEGEFLNLYNVVSHFVRKSAHFLSYTLLGSLTCLAVGAYRSKETKLIKNAIFSFPICILYASLDEFHQTFVGGRAGRVSDVLLDSTGALVGTLLAFLFCKVILIIIQKRAKTKNA